MTSDITKLLADYEADRDIGLDELITAVYPELRRIAHARLNGERRDHTLSTTGVVNEAYLRLIDQTSASWRDRGHFFAVASRIMRNILVDYARRRTASKRGGKAVRIEYTENFSGADADTENVLLLDAALSDLAAHDKRLEKTVECRFFGGMTAQETADILGVSLRTVERDWVRAKAYLYKAMHDQSND